MSDDSSNMHFDTLDLRTKNELPKPDLKRDTKKGIDELDNFHSSEESVHLNTRIESEVLLVKSLDVEVSQILKKSETQLLIEFLKEGPPIAIAHPKAQKNTIFGKWGTKNVLKSRSVDQSYIVDSNSKSKTEDLVFREAFDKDSFDLKVQNGTTKLRSGQNHVRNDINPLLKKPLSEPSFTLGSCPTSFAQTDPHKYDKKTSFSERPYYGSRRSSLRYLDTIAHDKNLVGCDQEYVNSLRNMAISSRKSEQGFPKSLSNGSHDSNHESGQLKAKFLTAFDSNHTTIDTNRIIQPRQKVEMVLPPHVLPVDFESDLVALARKNESDTSNAHSTKPSMVWTKTEFEQRSVVVCSILKSMEELANDLPGREYVISTDNYEPEQQQNLGNLKKEEDLDCFDKEAPEILIASLSGRIYEEELKNKELTLLMAKQKREFDKLSAQAYKKIMRLENDYKSLEDEHNTLKGFK